MSERDRNMPAATAAVVGLTAPSVQERTVGKAVREKLKDFGGAADAVRQMLDQKRRDGGGHANGAH